MRVIATNESDADMFIDSLGVVRETDLGSLDIVGIKLYGPQYSKGITLGANQDVELVLESPSRVRRNDQPPLNKSELAFTTTDQFYIQSGDHSDVANPVALGNNRGIPLGTKERITQPGMEGYRDRIVPLHFGKSNFGFPVGVPFPAAVVLIVLVGIGGSAAWNASSIAKFIGWNVVALQSPGDGDEYRKSPQIIEFRWSRPLLKEPAYMFYLATVDANKKETIVIEKRVEDTRYTATVTDHKSYVWWVEALPAPRIKSVKRAFKLEAEVPSPSESPSSTVDASKTDESGPDDAQTTVEPNI